MPYIKKEFKTIKGKKIEEFLKQNINEDFKLTFELLKKGKITDENNKRLQQNEIIKSDYIYIKIFEAKSKNIKPIFENLFFAIFDKPSGVLIHPKNSDSKQYSLLDEIRFLYGKNASFVHRIDKETSGLVLVSKNKFSETILKQMFENKEYKKVYKAIVKGKILQEILIDQPIDFSNSLVDIKMCVRNSGKSSQTLISPIKYDEIKNETLVNAIPFTGRQHQIRVHLDYIGHSIVGDPIYGIEEQIANNILLKKLSKQQRIKYTKSERLLLQAHYIEFDFLDTSYKFVSKQNF